MRTYCACGNIASYWYAPVVYKIMNFDEYVKAHCYCDNCADTDNWAEYQYIGHHKTKWQWFRKKETLRYLVDRNERLSKPYYDVTHVKEDGRRWGLGRYRSMEEVDQATVGLNFVEVKERYYD